MMTTNEVQRWTHVLGRWPSALAVGLALAMGGGGLDSMMEGWGETLPLLPLIYLVLAKLRRRRATWPALAVGTTILAALQVLDVIAPSVVLVALALIVLVWSVADGELREDGTLRAQALGMVGFGALALVGLAVDPDLGRYLVAAGWFLHGVWDFVHLRLDKVVVRSYAEWCGVLDVLVAVQLVFLV